MSETRHTTPATPALVLSRPTGAPQLRSMIRQIGIGIGMAIATVFGIVLFTVAFLANAVTAALRGNTTHETRNTHK